MEKEQEKALEYLKVNLQTEILIETMFGIKKNILEDIVKSAPDETKKTSHFKLLESTLNFYNSVEEIQD